jgi:cytochrome P450
MRLSGKGVKRKGGAGDQYCRIQVFVPAAAPAEAVDAVEAAAAGLREYCAELIERRRSEPADDLVTHLLEVELDGHRLDDREVIATMSGFIFAGSETTRRQLTAMVLAFADHPDSWRRLVDEPDLVPLAVEEVLRRHGIVPALSRLAVEALEHDDLLLLEGDRLLLMFDTANRDPAVFDDPDTFDVGRTNAGEHVTFGWGPHFCLGAGLARVELQEALTALLERFGPPVVEPGDEPGATNFGVPDELLVTFPPR